MKSKVLQKSFRSPKVQSLKSKNFSTVVASVTDRHTDIWTNIWTSRAAVAAKNTDVYKKNYCRKMMKN